jgi:hypothetical protein
VYNAPYPIVWTPPASSLPPRRCAPFAPSPLPALASPSRTFHSIRYATQVKCHTVCAARHGSGDPDLGWNRVDFIYFESTRRLRLTSTLAIGPPSRRFSLSVLATPGTPTPLGKTPQRGSDNDSDVLLAAALDLTFPTHIAIPSTSPPSCHSRSPTPLPSSETPRS